MINLKKAVFFKLVFFQNKFSQQLFLQLSRLRHNIYSTLGLCCLIFSTQTWSNVGFEKITDVTTRAFCVVWASDEPVTTATINIYSDVDGTDNITSSFSISTESSSAALDQGLVKVCAIGLDRDTNYYVETITNSDPSGQIIFPDALATLLVATTASQTTKADEQNRPITNDLFQVAVDLPDDTGAAPTALVVVNVPNSNPISAFVEEFSVNEFDEKIITKAKELVDSNNLFDNTTGISAKLVGGEKMTIQKYRGLECDFENHVLAQIRRVPLHDESPAITEIEQPAFCFVQADFNCDNRVGLEDLGTLAARFGLEQPDCRFNPDLDFNQDGRVGLFDLGALAAEFGTEEQ